MSEAVRFVKDTQQVPWVGGADSYPTERRPTRKVIFRYTHRTFFGVRGVPFGPGLPIWLVLESAPSAFGRPIYQMMTVAV